MKRYPPIDPSTNDLFQTAKDGVLLCKLIDLVVPGTIDERTINTKKISTYGRGMKIVICLDSAKTIGCTVVNIETRDLVEGRPHLLLGLKEIHLNNDLLHRFYGMELSSVLKAIESHQDQVSCVPPNGIVWVILHRQILRYLQLETLYLVFIAIQNFQRMSCWTY
jgi:plastin-1